jgi:hypothetical protein
LGVSVIARLFNHEPIVDPGGEVLLELLIRNTGRVVDQYTLDVLGEAAAWSEVPAVVPLYPGTEQTAQVVIRPPRASSTAARRVPFAVRVSSGENPDATTVEEGVLEVRPFVDTFAELIPGTSRGRRRGVHEVAVDNRGNTPMNADIVAVDPSNELRFVVRPPIVVVGPGRAVLARVVVRPRRRFWRGEPRTRSFRVQVRQEGQAPIDLGGTMLHEPMLPGWTVPAAAALMGLLLAGVLLWFAVLRPTIQTAARDAARQTTQSTIAGPLAQVGAVTGQQQRDIAGLQQAVNKISPDAVAAAVASNPPANRLGSPTDGRLQPGQLTLTVPDKTTVSVTDIIFENPDGDGGPIRLRRVAADGTVTVLMDPRLDNFRDLDYHFVAPITLLAGQKLDLDISGCKPGPGAAAGAQCTANVYYTGYRGTNP